MTMSEIYKKIYDDEFNKLARWKQVAVNDDVANKKSSGLTDEFIKLVIEKAEKYYEQNKNSNTTKKVVFEECI
jgi:hypothetical protein